ncbi:MAG: C_GCAxxG_C_C family protein [Clostridia bacterium]|nr:C_GCAxxG_C_C family protein [Clostridia bacterium]
MTKGEKAKRLFLSGKNCSQAVVLAFSEEIGLKEEDLSKLFVGFGGGFARQRLICGAVSGMNAVISFCKSDGDKVKAYALVQKAIEEVKKELGSIICGELLSGITSDTSPNAEKRTAKYYKKRPCADICALCATVAEKIIKE